MSGGMLVLTNFGGKGGQVSSSRPRPLLFFLRAYSVCEGNYLAHLADGFDFRRRSNCRAVGGVFLHRHTRWRRVANYEGGNHDEEENACDREHGEEVGI